MLRRSASVDFAPNLYTGVGGKIEREEGHREGALRELTEELNEDERTSVFRKEDLKEFGRVVINGRSMVAYFAFSYYHDSLPCPHKNVGELGWVPLETVMDLDIVPTTRYFMEEWRKRGWHTDRPFTVLLTREDADDVHSRVSHIEIREGLIGEAPQT